MRPAETLFSRPAVTPRHGHDGPGCWAVVDGVRLAGTATLGLSHRDTRRALVSVRIGVGQGIASQFETAAA